MLSGLENICPGFCQKLKFYFQDTLSQVAQILIEIPDEHRTCNNSTKLTESIYHVLYDTVSEASDFRNLPAYRTKESEEVIIATNGASSPQV